MKKCGFQVEELWKMTGMTQHGSNSKAYPCNFYKRKGKEGNKRKAIEIAMNPFREMEAFLLCRSLDTKLYVLSEEVHKEIVSPRKKKWKFVTDVIDSSSDVDADGTNVSLDNISTKCCSRIVDRSF